MYVHGLIRASFGFVGLCLVAFVQQSASGSKTSQGKFSPQNHLFRNLKNMGGKCMLCIRYYWNTGDDGTSKWSSIYCVMKTR